MTIYMASFLIVLALALYNLPPHPRAEWAAYGIVGQTAFSYAIQLTFGYENILPHAFLFCVVGCAYLYYSTWSYGAALGLCSFLICLSFVGGWAGLISVETGQGALSPTVWNFKTILCYLQLYILWEMGNGIRSGRSAF